MQCPTCARPMRPLFISCVCDFCDGLVADDRECDRGYVVWRSQPLPAEEYVFSTREGAERWRQLKGLWDCEIRTVLAPVRFRWRLSHGAASGLEMADALVTIYPDRRFPPAPNRAYLDASKRR